MDKKNLDTKFLTQKAQQLIEKGLGASVEFQSTVESLYNAPSLNRREWWRTPTFEKYKHLLNQNAPPEQYDEEEEDEDEEEEDEEEEDEEEEEDDSPVASEAEEDL